MRCPNLTELPLSPASKIGWPWTEESEQLPDTMPDGSPWPRLSIVTPSYNQAQFIEETIRSVLLQGYPDIEYVIVDGGSTDGSVDIIRKYEPWITYWVSESDAGQADAINKGFAKATGVIYSWLNSDDSFLPQALQKVADAYQRNSDAGGWFGGCRRVDAVGNLLFVHWPNDVGVEDLANWHENWVQQPACFFSRRFWEAGGTLDNDLYCAIDFDLWLRLAKDWSIEKIDQELAIARSHPGAKTSAQRSLMFAETYYVQVRHGFHRQAISDMAIREKKMTSRIETLAQADRILTFMNQSTPLTKTIVKTNMVMMKAIDAFKKQQWPTLRHLLWKVLLRDPSWLLKRNYLSMLAQAYHLKRRGQNTQGV